MRMEAVIGDATSAAEWLRAVADLITVIAPSIEQRGVARLADVDCESLADRMIQEVSQHHSLIVGRAELGAWVRVDS